MMRVEQGLNKNIYTYVYVTGITGTQMHTAKACETFLERKKNVDRRRKQ